MRRRHGRPGGDGEPLDLRGDAAGAAGVRRRGRARRLLVVEEEQVVRLDVVLRPGLLQLLVDHLVERLGANTIHQELQARLRAVLPELVGGVEDADDIDRKLVDCAPVEDRLLALSARAPAADPAPALWPRIAARLDWQALPGRETAVRTPWWQGLRFWQGLSAMGVAASLVQAPEGGTRNGSSMGVPKARARAAGWLAVVP